MVPVPAKRVVVGIDGSENSDLALTWAAREALLRGLPLEVVLAWDASWMTSSEGIMAIMDVDEAFTRLGALAATHVDESVARLEARADVPGLEQLEIIRTPVRGPVVPTVITAADGAAELVVGRRGTGRLGRLFMGSVSAGIVRQAHLPVTIIPDPGRAEVQRTAALDGAEPDDTPRVVVGVDGSAPAAQALRFAAEVARLRDLPLHVVACWQLATTGPLPETFGWAPPLDDYAAHTGDLLERSIVDSGISVPDDRLVRHVVRASPGRGLLRAAAGASQLVLGSRGLGGFERLMLGSVSSQLIEHAPCPVTVVRS